MTSQGTKTALACLAIPAALWIVWHPFRAELTRMNPPVSCQLLGGTWDIWNGWRCG